MQRKIFHVAAPKREFDGLELTDARVVCYREARGWVCECRGLGISKAFEYDDAAAAARVWLRECGFERVALSEGK